MIVGFLSFPIYYCIFTVEPTIGLLVINKTRGESMIFMWFLVLVDYAVGLENEAFNKSEMDMFSKEIFNRYNENAETFQTGVLVRLNDDNFLFGNASDPLGMSCTEGYMRPVVLNVIRSELEVNSNIFRTQVVMKNLTIFYKDCRVLEESEMFLSGTLKTPCFLTIDISSLIGWAIVRSKRYNDNACDNSVDMDMGDDITGAGTVRLFFLRSSTLYTFSLFLDYAWTKKIQEAVSRTSLILLSDFNECVVMPEMRDDAPSFEVTTLQDYWEGTVDDKDSMKGRYEKEDVAYNESYIDEYKKYPKMSTTKEKKVKTASSKTTSAATQKPLGVKKFGSKEIPPTKPAKDKPEKKYPATKRPSLNQNTKIGKNYRDINRSEVLKLPEMYG